MQKKQTYSSGFTLVEAIVAISILMISVIVPIALYFQSIRSAADARFQVTAVHLAEESNEVVRAIRDNNSAHDTTTNRTQWMSQIYDTCKNGCVIDVTAGRTGAWGPSAATACSGGACATVYQNSTNGLFRQSVTTLPAPWVATQFTRVTTITGIDSTSNPQQEVRVTTTVTFPGWKGITRSVSSSDDLTNWFPQLTATGPVSYGTNIVSGSGYYDPIGPTGPGVSEWHTTLYNGVSAQNGNDIKTNPDYWEIMSGWIRYPSVQFGTDPKARMSLKVGVTYENGVDQSGQMIDIRLDALDGPLIGTLVTKRTCIWGDYQWQTFSITPTTGSHTVYAVPRNTHGTVGNAVAWRIAP